MAEAIKAANLDPKFREEVAGRLKAFDLGNCLACGMCSAGCPYNDLLPGHDPRKLLRKILLGMREEVISDPYIWICNTCERCTVECPMKINFAVMVRSIRGNYIPKDKVPGFMQKVVQEQIETGNQMSVDPTDYIETLEWIEEELQAELDDPNYKIPIDKEDADYFYGFNAREIKYYPQDLQAVLKVFYAAGFNYTLSSKKWDATNLALFSGHDDDFWDIQRPLFEEVVRLRAKELIVTECGHAFKSSRNAYRAFWKGQPFPIRHILQLLDEALKDGRLKVDPEKMLTDPITIHDPCNTVRKEGVFEEPRNVMRAFCKDFRDMSPNKKYNYCCGGGGGQMAMPEYTEQRLIKGKRKADQVIATGAKIVAVPCHNCMDQFNDLTKHYKLGTKNEHVCSLMADTLILPEKKTEE